MSKTNRNKILCLHSHLARWSNLVHKDNLLEYQDWHIQITIKQLGSRLLATVVGPKRLCRIVQWSRFTLKVSCVWCNVLNRGCSRDIAPILHFGPLTAMIYHITSFIVLWKIVAQYQVRGNCGRNIRTKKSVEISSYQADIIVKKLLGPSRIIDLSTKPNPLNININQELGLDQWSSSKFPSFSFRN